MDAKKIEDIIVLIKLSGIRDGMAKSMSKQIEYSKQATSLFTDGGFLPGIKDVKQLLQLILEESNIDELVGMVIPLIDSHYKHSEIKALIKFFKSDIGRVFRERSVAVNAEIESVKNTYMSMVVERIRNKYPDL